MAETPKKTIDEIIDELDDEFDTKLDDLKDEINLDLKFGNLDRNGMDSEIMKTVSSFHRWAGVLATEKRQLQKIDNYCSRIYAQLYEHYRTERADIALKGKAEIEQWIIRSPRYAKCACLRDQQKIVVEYLENALNAFRNKSFALKNIIENRRYFDG